MLRHLQLKFAEAQERRPLHNIYTYRAGFLFRKTKNALYFTALVIPFVARGPEGKRRRRVIPSCSSVHAASLHARTPSGSRERKHKYNEGEKTQVQVLHVVRG